MPRRVYDPNCGLSFMQWSKAGDAQRYQDKKRRKEQAKIEDGRGQPATASPRTAAKAQRSETAERVDVSAATWTSSISFPMLAVAAVSSVDGDVHEAHVEQVAATVPLLEEQRASALMTPATVLWGAIPEEEARAAGALTGVHSVCIAPDVPVDILEGFLSLLPEHVFPRKYDTPDVLAARLGGSDWLDDIRSMSAGHNRINSSAMPQPRRKTYGVRRRGTTAEDGGDAQELYAYPSPRYDYSCTVLPGPAWRLLLYLWHVASPHLTAEQRAKPPNSMQILLCSPRPWSNPQP